MEKKKWKTGQMPQSIKTLSKDGTLTNWVTGNGREGEEGEVFKLYLLSE